MTHSIILRRCATLHEALICTALLTDRGILASLDNAEHAAQDWGLVSALGGIHIRVPVSQAEDARNIIIDQVSTADETLKLHALPGDPIPKKSPWKAISMLVIYFGIFQFIASLGLVSLDNIIPSDWVPAADQTIVMVGIWTGGSVAPPGPGIDGLVFLFFIVLLLAWELLSTRETQSNKEPQL